VCFIQEIGGLSVKRGDRFAAAYAVGYFDSVEEMATTCDALRGFTSLAATKDYWLLAEGVIVREGTTETERGGSGEPPRFLIVPQGQWPAPKTYRVLAHGRGKAVINGKTVTIDGESAFEVPDQ